MVRSRVQRKYRQLGIVRQARILTASAVAYQPWRRVMFKSPRDRDEDELAMLDETLTPKVWKSLLQACPSGAHSHYVCRLSGSDE